MEKYLALAGLAIVSAIAVPQILDSNLEEGAKAERPAVQQEQQIARAEEPVKDRKVVILSTNDGRENRYLEYAWADFAINDVKCRLLILEVMEDGPEKGSLFLAFADETSARETYGAGRYLDINKVPGSSSVLLDFNKAYNPYCAYSDNFSCPFPPKQNILGVPIRAGEKTYH